MCKLFIKTMTCVWLLISVQSIHCGSVYLTQDLASQEDHAIAQSKSMCDVL